MSCWDIFVIFAYQQILTSFLNSVFGIHPLRTVNDQISWHYFHPSRWDILIKSECFTQWRDKRRGQVIGKVFGVHPQPTKNICSKVDKVQSSVIRDVSDQTNDLIFTVKLTM